MKRSLRSAVIFGVGNGLTPGIGFLLLPRLHTRTDPCSEYGPLSVLLAISSAAWHAVHASGSTSVFSVSYLRRSRTTRSSQRRFLGSAWRFLIFAPLTGAIALTAVGAPLITSILRSGVGCGPVPRPAGRGPLRRRQRSCRSWCFASNERLGRIPRGVRSQCGCDHGLWSSSLLSLLHLGITGWLGASAASNLVLPADRVGRSCSPGDRDERIRLGTC